jgi:nucleoside-diphosphate kinase
MLRPYRATVHVARCQAPRACRPAGCDEAAAFAIVAGMEQTLILVKPDGVQRGLVGPILARFEARGLKMVGLKLMQVPTELAQRHYAVHEGKPFYEGLIRYITSGPIVALVLEGTNAVAAVRKTVGATRSFEAEPGSIRGDLALEVGRNLVHASDSPETAREEVELWFRGDELADYSRDTDRWIFE